MWLCGDPAGRQNRQLWLVVVIVGGRLEVQEEGPATLLLPVARARKPASAATQWHPGGAAATTAQR